MSARWFGDGKGDEMSQATGLACKDVSLTKQADKESADINNIMKRYEKTGQLPEMIKTNPHWGDYSDAPTFQEAFEIVQKAEDQFAALDAQVRKRFGNNPAAFLEFASDPKNAKEMVDLGLLIPQDRVEEPNPPLASKPTREAPVAADKGVGQ